MPTETTTLEALLRRWAELEAGRCRIERLRDTPIWRGNPPMAYCIYWDDDEEEPFGPITILVDHANELDIWDRARLQIVTQEAIEARGWHFQLMQSELLNTPGYWASVWTEFRAEDFESDNENKPAIALLSAYLTALEAQQ